MRARACNQIPRGWMREGPRASYRRPEGSTCTAERLDVYRGYVGGKVAAFLAVWYDGEGKWYNRRFSGRNLTEIDAIVADAVKEHGYAAATS